MIDEETLKERVNDFYKDYPLNHRLLGGLTIIISLLSFTLLIEQITNEAKIIEIIFANLLLTIASLFIGIILIVCKRKEYTKRIKIIFIILGICILISYIFKCIFYIGFFDQFIHTIIFIFTIYCAYKGGFYNLQKEYDLFFTKK